MQLFRKLANNVLFKIILAFVAVTFVLFGISGFILGNPNDWVVKIGDTTIGVVTFNKALQNDREIILSSNKSEEAIKYLDSARFKSDVLGRIVNKAMIEKLQDEFGVFASKKIILETIAKDPNFRNEDGKFNIENFRNFLAKRGLNEEKYVNEIANEITAIMIIQSLVAAAPLNEDFIRQNENFKQEKRIADVITISEKNVATLEQPTDEEVQKFFEENKQKYTLPETRKVSYLSFSTRDFAKENEISEKEVFAEYEKNQTNFTSPENRNFYHVLFEKEQDAKTFLQKLDEAAKSDKSKLKDSFSKLAKDLAKKDLKAITLNKISQKDLVPQLAEPIFKLQLNHYSNVLQSPMGFHIFLLNEIREPQLLPFNEVKHTLKNKMLEGRTEKIMQQKISEIDDALLTSNSLIEVAKKFNLKLGSAPVEITQTGQDKNGNESLSIRAFEDFAQNAFAAQKGQVSRIFYSKNSDIYYALKVEEINPPHTRDLSEIKAQIFADLLKTKKYDALQVMARRIGNELRDNPNSAATLVSRYQLKIEKNREFPRVSYVEFQGQKMPYRSEFLQQLFRLKLNEATYAIASGEKEFSIGILRAIKKTNATETQLKQAKENAVETFKTEVLQEFNSYLLKKNPVKVNEKILGQNKGSDEL